MTQISIQYHVFFILTFILPKMSRIVNFQFSIKNDNKPMGLFPGGLIFGRFLFTKFLGLFSSGLIFEWAYFREITVCDHSCVKWLDCWLNVLWLMAIYKYCHIRDKWIFLHWNSNRPPSVNRTLFHSPQVTRFYCIRIYI